MKIADLKGNWVGLAHVDGYPYSVEDSSSSDGWKIGFDIVYRLYFVLDVNQIKDERLRCNFREAFLKAFGLSEDHCETGGWPGEAGGESVFWRIYWDKQAFDLRLLKKCEESLNECAEQNKTRVLLLDVVVIPRSQDRIAELVKWNHPSIKDSTKSR